MIRVKICCIESPEEAAQAVREGASALGLVSSMPSGPGVIGKDRIRRVATSVPPAVATFLLTSELEPEPIIAQQRHCRTNTLQLVDSVSPDTRLALRDALPGVAIVQVVHVVGGESVDEARTAAETADAILLDSGRTTGKVRELGGTGRTHDWTVSREIVQAVDVPVFLAGGLNAENVGEAVRQVRPFGVDLCTGVRSEGRLDRGRLRAFMAALASET